MDISKRIYPQHLLAIKEALWPQVRLYDKQIEILISSVTIPETYAPAGNKLGKDYIAGLIALTAFLACQAKGITCRIVTTSVAEHHLKVLWGEISQFIGCAKQNLLAQYGGPLVVNHQEIRRKEEAELKNPLNYLVGRVSAHGEGLAGHHAEFTMLIGDESSGLSDTTYEMGQGWAKHMFFPGNPNPCQNFFFKNVEAGDVINPDGKYDKRIVRITAYDSPNVKGAFPPFPGLLTRDEFDYRERNWDEVRKCVGLYAQFYKGSQLLLFPPDWLNHAEAQYRLRPPAQFKRWMGVDPAEGGDSSSWAIVDSLGLIELVSMKTPDTTRVTSQTIALMRKHGIPAEHVVFDRGGGGKEHADRLRSQGLNVRTVAFGESLLLEPKRGMRFFKEKVENREERYAYVNRRAQMYGELSLIIDPNCTIRPDDTNGRQGFALPTGPLYTELRRQLAVFPKQYDQEGRLKLPPKNRKTKESSNANAEKCLVEILGRSPDEADSLVLAVHGLLHKAPAMKAGSVG